MYRNTHIETQYSSKGSLLFKPSSAETVIVGPEEVSDWVPVRHECVPVIACWGNVWLTGLFSHTCCCFLLQQTGEDMALSAPYQDSQNLG